MEKKIQRTILLACDHAGIDLKKTIINYLESKKLVYKDFGTNSSDRCDYPDYAEALCKEMDRRKDIAIFVCGTGTGISIAANKFKGIRCAVCNNSHVAKAAIENDYLNSIALGERVIGEKAALEILDMFLNKKLYEPIDEKQDLKDEMTELEEKFLVQ